MIDIIALQALFGASIPVSKVLLSCSQPFFLAGLRLFLAGILLIVYNYWYKKRPVIIYKYQLFLYAQIIFFGVYAKYMLRYWSLQYLSAIKMSFMFNITPFIASVVSFFILDELITVKQFIGMFIGFLSIVPLLMTAPTVEALNGQLLYLSLPECVLLLAIVSHCYSMAVARKLVQYSNQPVSLTNGIRMLGGGSLCLLTAFYVEGFFPVTCTAPFIAGVLFLILLSNVICHGWHLHLLKSHSITFLSLSDFLNPLFTAFYGVLFLHEVMTWHYAASVGLVCIGLYLFYQDEQKKIYAV